MRRCFLVLFLTLVHAQYDFLFDYHIENTPPVCCVNETNVTYTLTAAESCPDNGTTLIEGAPDISYCVFNFTVVNSTETPTPAPTRRELTTSEVVGVAVGATVGVVGVTAIASSTGALSGLFSILHIGVVPVTMRLARPKNMFDDIKLS